MWTFMYKWTDNCLNINSFFKFIMLLVLRYAKELCDLECYFMFLAILLLFLWH